MQRRNRIMAALILAGGLLTPVSQAATVAAESGSRQITSGGSAALAPSRDGSDAIQFPEFAFRPESEAAGTAGAPVASANRLQSATNGGQSPRGPNRSLSAERGAVGTGISVAQPEIGEGSDQPELLRSFNGLNFRQQRLANGGNQFSLEPPDQGLCAGNGMVLETINDVIRLFDTNGNPLTGVVDLNTFYGYAAAINRATNDRGPEVTDPSCLFDGQTRRWFHAALTLEVVSDGKDPRAGRLTGPNHLDLAVSKTADPRDGFAIYRLPVQDDGTQGTPNHHCTPVPRPWRTNPAACIGDFPHIGADTNGFYITTNEYDLFGDNFKAAQIYAFSKNALARNDQVLTITQIDTTGLQEGKPGFTVWPATSPSLASFERSNRGVEYFLSSNAAEEVSGVPNSQGTNSSEEIVVWALTNTESLRGNTPNLQLTNDTVDVNKYAVPRPSKQKVGSTPLRDCVNDTAMATPLGPGCWQFFFLPKDEPQHDEVEGELDSSDSRMLSTVFSRGVLLGTLDTAVTVNGKEQAGTAFYAIRPTVIGGRLNLRLLRQGVVSAPNNNVIYGAVAATESGKAIIGFTLVGEDHFPSAAYVSLGDNVTAADIKIVAEGLGPQDGFTEYKAFVGTPIRPRWGDYGAALVQGDNIWIANEWTGQTCTLQQYANPPTFAGFGSCGGTRASLGNWYTRLTALDVNQ